MAHDAAISLKPGSDHFLTVLEQLSCLLALPAIWFSPTNWWFGVSGSAACVLAWAMLRRFHGRYPWTGLLIYPDRRAKYRLSEPDWYDAVIAQQAWVTPKYAVISLRMRSGTHRMLISRSRQQGGEYRKLLAWLRLGFPAAGQES